MLAEATTSHVSARSSRVEAFLVLFHAEARGNPTKAAELAGYDNPKAEGPRLARRYKAELARRLSALKAEAQVSEDEALEALAQVIRDPKHKDRMKALELQLRVHGKLSDKASVEDSKVSFVKELRLMMEAAAKGRKEAAPSRSLKSPEVVDAEVVEAKKDPA